MKGFDDAKAYLRLKLYITHKEWALSVSHGRPFPIQFQQDFSEFLWSSFACITIPDTWGLGITNL
jgi:hypothetical protein